MEPGFLEIQTLFSLMGVSPYYLSHSRYTDYGTVDPPFEEIRCILQDNIKVRLKIRWKDVDSSHLAEDRDKERVVVNTVLNLPVHFCGHGPRHTLSKKNCNHYPDMYILARIATTGNPNILLHVFPV